MPRYKNVVELSRKEKKNILKGVLMITSDNRWFWTGVNVEFKEKLFSYIEGLLLKSWEMGPKGGSVEDEGDEFEEAEYENW